MKVPAEDFAHHLRLATAQQAIVYENASELVANGLVQQGGSDTGIHAAAQAQNDLLAVHLRADGLDGLLDVIVHRPVFAAAANIVNEVGQDLFATGGMG